MSHLFLFFLLNCDEINLIKYSFHKRLVIACGSAIENNYANLGILIIQKTELSHLVCVAWRGPISLIIT